MSLIGGTTFVTQGGLFFIGKLWHWWAFCNLEVADLLLRLSSS